MTTDNQSAAQSRAGDGRSTCIDHGVVDNCGARLFGLSIKEAGQATIFPGGNGITEVRRTNQAVLVKVDEGEWRKFRMFRAREDGWWKLCDHCGNRLKFRDPVIRYGRNGYFLSCLNCQEWKAV